MVRFSAWCGVVLGVCPRPGVAGRFKTFISVGLKPGSSTGVVYSPPLRGYVSDRRANKAFFSLGGLKAELFANSNELRHLAATLGPIGVRLIEAELLAHVRTL